MKKTLLLGLILHITYYVFAILSLIDYGYADSGMSKSFAFWIYAMIIALPVTVIYLIDAIRSFTKCRKTFNIFKLVAVIILAFLYPFVGCTAGVTESIIWNSFFLALFVIEIISMFIKDTNND